jgi:hypothetical protein
MSNSTINTPVIAIPQVAVEVQFSACNKSCTTIGTSDLGPCMAILIDLTHNQQPMCVLEHYSFMKDEKKSYSSPLERLKWFMEHILEMIQEVTNESIFDKLRQPRIRETSLLITGGDILEGKYIRDLGVNNFTNKSNLTQVE